MDAFPVTKFSEPLGVPLSENVVSDMLHGVGMAYSKMVSFMRARVQKGAEPITKPANELYSYKQIFRYLSKCKKVRIEENREWMDSPRLKCIDRICSALGV